MPELGNEQAIYVNKVDKVISVWDAESSEYITVSDYTNEVTSEDIENLFV